MSKTINFFRRSYIVILLILFYIPIVFGAIYSFNQQGKKGNAHTRGWDGLSFDGWSELGKVDKWSAMVNSIILGIIVSLFVAILSLITVFALWKQKNRVFKASVDGTSNIPLINPDIITAVGLAIVFGAMFGTLTISSDGMWRAIISHTTMILPYGIIIMYPRSQKFSVTLMEASKDLGYNSIKTWFKTYFIFMIPTIIAVIAISLTLSFDDFILTRTTSNVTTIGTKLYEGSFKTWMLALGAILLMTSLIGVGIYSFIKKRKNA